MSTTHNHTEYVARDLHLAYHRVGDNKPDASFVPWGTLIVTDPAEADRWRWVAKQALPILATLAGLGVVKTTGCTSAQQADAAALHRLYHDVTGTPCRVTENK